MYNPAKQFANVQPYQASSEHRQYQRYVYDPSMQVLHLKYEKQWLLQIYVAAVFAVNLVFSSDLTNKTAYCIFALGKANSCFVFVSSLTLLMMRKWIPTSTEVFRVWQRFEVCRRFLLNGYDQWLRRSLTRRHPICSQPRITIFISRQREVGKNVCPDDQIDRRFKSTSLLRNTERLMLGPIPRIA